MTRETWRLDSINPSCSISVIVPTWNEQTTIRKAVESAWAAGATQVLVVDGGSSDNTCHLAQEAGAEIIAAATRGRGQQQAWGVAHATSDLLVFLHADSYFEENAFLPLREIVAARTGQNVWGGFRQKITDARWQYRVLEFGNHQRTRWFSWVYGDQGLWVSTATLKEAGGFPRDPLMEDLILSRRLRRLSKPHVCKSTIYTSPRRWHRDGVIRRTLKNWWLVTQYFAGRSTSELEKKYRK